MRISMTEFMKLCEQSEQITNLDPEFIPSEEQIKELQKYTQKIRQDQSDFYNEIIPETHCGRAFMYASRQNFIKIGKTGEPLIPEEYLMHYLIYISETGKPETNQQKEYFSQLNKYLQKNLEIEDELWRTKNNNHP